MGEQPTCNMFIRTVCVVTLATLAALTLAKQPVDVVIPEGSTGTLSLRDVPVASSQLSAKTPRQAAMDTYHFLQESGNDDAACRDLANDMIKEAQDAVKTATENLNNVDLGETCPATNQEEVDNAQTAVDNAKEETDKAKEALDDVMQLTVTMTVDYIPEPDVTHFTSTSEWQEAAEKYEEAKKKVDERPAVEKSLEDALAEEKETQTTEQNKCYCKAKDAYTKAVEINDDPDAVKQREDDYAKAQELLCVLDDKSPCNYDPLASVTVPKLPEATANAQCTSL